MSIINSVYQIRLIGRVSLSLQNHIDDMQIRQEHGKDIISLVGQLPDQSALLGLLNTLNDIRYEILSVEMLSGSFDASSLK